MGFPPFSQKKTAGGMPAAEIKKPRVRVARGFWLMTLIDQIMPVRWRPPENSATTTSIDFSVDRFP
jgi:hypothetical protein